MPLGRLLFPASAALLLVALPLVFAHGEHASAVNPSGEHGSNATVHVSASGKTYPTTYFRLTKYPAWMYAHIGLMILGWTVVLPIGNSDPENWAEQR